MGASLAVILANIWLKEYEPAIQLEIPEWNTPANNCKEMCSHCNKNWLQVQRGTMPGMLELVYI